MECIKGLCNAYIIVADRFNYLNPNPEIDNKDKQCKYFKKKFFARKKKENLCTDCKFYIKIS
jgi:hypothetical protein